MKWIDENVNAQLGLYKQKRSISANSANNKTRMYALVLLFLMRSLRLSERCYVFACTIPTKHLYSHRFKYMIANKVDVTWFNCNYDRLLLMFGQRSSVTENRFTEEKSSHFTNALIPMTFCFRLYLSFRNVNGKSNHEWWTRCRDEVRNIANWSNNKIATKHQKYVLRLFL